MNKIYGLLITCLVLFFGCEEEEYTSADYVPSLDIIVLDNSTNKNPFDLENPIYDVEGVKFYIENGDTLDIAVKKDAKYGTYFTVDPFGGMLWENFLDSIGESYTGMYKFKLAEGVIEDVKLRIEKIPPRARVDIFFNGISGTYSDLDFKFVLKKNLPKVPPVNILIQDSEKGKNLLDLGVPFYNVRKIKFYKENGEQANVTTKKDAKRGTYLSIDPFENMLWKELLDNAGEETSIKRTYLLKLSETEVDTIHFKIENIHTAPTTSLLVKGVLDGYSETDSLFELKKEAQKFPPLDILIVNKATNENLLDLTPPTYVREQLKFFDKDKKETPISLKEDENLGTYLSVDPFKEQLWYDFLGDIDKDFFSKIYKLKLSDVDTVTVKLKIENITLKPETSDISLFFDGVSGIYSDVDFKFVLKKEVSATKQE